MGLSLSGDHVFGFRYSVTGKGGTLVVANPDRRGRKPGEPVPVCRSREGQGRGDGGVNTRQLSPELGERIYTAFQLRRERELTRARCSFLIASPPWPLLLVSGSNVRRLVWIGLLVKICAASRPYTPYALSCLFLSEFSPSVRYGFHSIEPPHVRIGNVYCTLERDDLHLPGREVYW